MRQSLTRAAIAVIATMLIGVPVSAQTGPLVLERTATTEEDVIRSSMAIEANPASPSAGSPAGGLDVLAESPVTTASLGLYSGRPDPSWELSEEESATLTALLESLPQVDGLPPSGGLGYHGFGIERLTPEGTSRLLVAFEGTVSDPDASHPSYLDDPDRSVERFLLDSGRGRLSASELLVLGAAISARPVALAQSPSGSPAPSTDASPAASVSPTAAPLSWPTLPPPAEVPVGKRLRPDGPPHATTSRHGVRVDLWLSSPTAAPGEWVQALVRTTNLRDTPVWAWSGGCGESGTRLDVDLGEIIPPGKVQVGNAAVFKEQALRWTDVGAFTPWRHLDDLASAASGRTFVECMTMPGPLELKAGASKNERFAWYPAHSFDGEVWFQPQYPGPVEVTVSWPYLSRGERPEMGERRAQRAVKPIKASAQLEVAGDGPGTPSLPELIDIALDDPEFRAWVDRKPSRESFCRDCISVTGWPGPTYENHLWLRDVPNAPPTGVLTVGLAQGGVFGTRGVVSIDPWTGEVLDVRLLGDFSGLP